VEFEQLYVLELMLIETDARRFIAESIEIERELRKMEKREKAKGRIVIDNDQYWLKRRELAKKIAAINSVANSEGKSRDDLEGEILEAAE